MIPLRNCTVKAATQDYVRIEISQIGELKLNWDAIDHIHIRKVD